MKPAKILIGWKEHCALPEFNIQRIVAKVDTGADTSCIHAVEIEPFLYHGHVHVRFVTHPIQFDESVALACTAPTIDYRIVRSSNGQHERRYVIETELVLGTHHFTTELTLTDRSELNFRMLLGKEFLSKTCLIDVGKKFCQDKLSANTAKP